MSESMSRLHGRGGIVWLRWDLTGGGEMWWCLYTGLHTSMKTWGNSCVGKRRLWTIQCVNVKLGEIVVSESMLRLYRECDILWLHWDLVGGGEMWWCLYTSLHTSMKTRCNSCAGKHDREHSLWKIQSANVKLCVIVMSESMLRLYPGCGILWLCWDLVGGGEM